MPSSPTCTAACAVPRSHHCWIAFAGWCPVAGIKERIMAEPTTSEQRVYLASVNVYGAGIAGLSAAHELMVRGFEVRVIEPDRGMGRDGNEAPAVGGLARNQFLEA